MLVTTADPLLCDFEEELGDTLAEVSPGEPCYCMVAAPSALQTVRQKRSHVDSGKECSEVHYGTLENVCKNVGEGER